jgi:chromosomal replication initiator protein
MTTAEQRGAPGAASRAPAAVWTAACAVLKTEIGADTFGSWLSHASLRQDAAGRLVLVTPTRIARDWIQRNAWRRICELWSQNDPQDRRLDLKSRVEFESEQGPAPPAPVTAATPIEAVEPVSSDVPEIAPARPARTTSAPLGLQERMTFATFVSGPANEFAHAVARRVGSWADGHFNPVLFHGSYGFGKTHLLNAIAWEALRAAPEKRVVYLTAERFLSSFVRAVMERQTAAF